jgi:AcrR family transcriptional regulator
MLYQLIVHSTTDLSSTLYDVAKDFRSHRHDEKGASDAAEALAQFVADAAGEKLARRAAQQSAKVRAKAAKHAAALERLAAHLEAVDVWVRAEPGSRRPRLSREQLAAEAVRLADVEGISAVSMRRIATELDVGTMTLYHYVRTKDELLALVTDAVMHELVLTDDLPDGWRQAIAAIAHRTRDTLMRHPWMLDIADDPAIGPNSVRHFDQCLRALRGLDVSLGAKLDVLMAVDEYVFGYCLHQRTTFAEDPTATTEMMNYVDELLSSGDFPELAHLVEQEGLEQTWSQVHAHAHDPARFDRNLQRLLDGIEQDLAPR